MSIMSRLNEDRSHRTHSVLANEDATVLTKLSRHSIVLREEFRVSFIILEAVGGNLVGIC
jgi:hypothetical protein